MTTATTPHGTLTVMDSLDADDRRELAELADTYRETPPKLRARIIAAGRKGGRPADIQRAIGHLFTYNYVAGLIREDKRATAKKAAETDAEAS